MYSSPDNVKVANKKITIPAHTYLWAYLIFPFPISEPTYDTNPIDILIGNRNTIPDEF